MTKARLDRPANRPEWLTAIDDHLNAMVGRMAARMDASQGYDGLKRLFTKRVGYVPDFANPQTFNEKINWRKLYDRASVYPVICDKVRMPEYLALRFGEARAKALVPTRRLVTVRPTAATLAAAGSGVAIKANHGSGWVRIVPDGTKPDWEELAAVARGWLRKVHGQRQQEWAYWSIPPQILVEDLVRNTDGSPACDIKIEVMDGRVVYLFLEADRFSGYQVSSYTRDWQPLQVKMTSYQLGAPVDRPERLEEMIALAEEIGTDFDYIRVDFLNGVDGFRLNELTIYAASGLARIETPGLDQTWGAAWRHRPYAGIWPTERR
jgi:hypothetical protein